MIFFVLLIQILSDTIFQENFNDGDGWKSRWVQSNFYSSDPSYYGTPKITPGEWYGDKEEDAGLQYSETRRHYTFASRFKEFNSDKNDYILQYSVKLPPEGIVDCVGAYLKVGNRDQLKNLEDLSEKTEFDMMFGPDVCGTNERVTLIFNYKNQYFEWTRKILPKRDVFTHVYTVWVKPDNTYEVQIDGKVEARGELEEHFEFPYISKTIKDKNDKKPDDWIDVKYIEGPDGKKMRNPEFKGRWKQKRIPNPRFEEDMKYYKRVVDWIGIENWSMKEGTIIDNILITDDFVVAKLEQMKIERRKKKEKVMHDRIEQTKNLELAEERERNLARQRVEREEAKKREAEELKIKEQQENQRIEEIKKKADLESKMGGEL